MSWAQTRPGGCRVNGKLNWIQVFSNSEYTLFGFNKKRSELYAGDMDILERFTGILVHDHFKSYYGYKLMTHAECNVHILRYLQAIIEIMKHPWATDLAEFFRNANKLKKHYLALGGNSIDENELNRISASLLILMSPLITTVPNVTSASLKTR